MTEALQPFESSTDAIYSLEAAARIAQVMRRKILIYYKHGLVPAMIDPQYGGYYFNNDAIRALRRIEFLRSNFGMNLAGSKLCLDLMNEVEQLQREVRFLRR